MARVRHGRRRLCGFCALPAACKRRSSRFTKFHGSDIDWHRHHGSQRRSWTPLDRDPSSETGFSVQALRHYFTVCFTLEEVAFRGALDSHLYRSPSNGRASSSSWLSAIFLSALWGIWHLPTLPTPSAPAFAAAIPALIIIHTLVGVPLSFCWRGSGTLVLPAAAHALIDAYRDTLL